MSIHSLRQSPSLLALPVLALASGCLASEDELGAGPGGAEDYRVQTEALWDHFEYMMDGTGAGRAIGSVSGPFYDAADNPITAHGYPHRWTCGITFIAPHYAVTAAHCVDEMPDVSTDTVTVETYDISDASLFALWAGSHVEGLFPNYERITQIEDFDTYRARRYDCSVRARCDYGQHDCSFSADIALVHCPDRPSSAPWIPVATSDPTTGPVEMYWAHEVIAAPTQEPQPPSSTANAETWDEYEQQRDLWEHYSLYAQGDRQNNWHYLGGSANVLVPLKSADWPTESGGGPRQRLGGSDLVGGTISTDLYGCHGTSGSGVFQRDADGDLEFLGPVAQGAGWARSRLCNDPDAAAPGVRGLAYTTNASTRALQSDYWWPLFLDRTTIVLDPGVLAP